MADGQLLLVLLAMAGAGVLVVATLVLYARARVRVPSGMALVIHGSGREPRVSFADTIVVPFFARSELVDCTTHTVAVTCEGKQSLRCRDRLRVDVRAELQVAVNRTAEDVLAAIAQVGPHRSGDPDALQALFAGRFVDAIASVVGQFAFESLGEDRDRLRDHVMTVVGEDLKGFAVQGVAFTRLEQLPLAQYDPDDMLDAEAIRRITERTSAESIRTSEIQTRQRMDLAARNLEADEAVLALQLAHQRHADELAARAARESGRG